MEENIKKQKSKLKKDIIKEGISEIFSWCAALGVLVLGAIILIAIVNPSFSNSLVEARESGKLASSSSTPSTTSSSNSTSTTKSSSSYSSKSSSSYSSSSNVSDAEIITLAKYNVKSKLKSPSTAKFCPQNQIKITRSSSGITVTGYVDAENSFGAKVRSNFRVVLNSSGKYAESVYIN